LSVVVIIVVIIIIAVSKQPVSCYCQLAAQLYKQDDI